MLVPMKQDGIEVRGIVQPDGTAEFCEVFFDNARCRRMPSSVASTTAGRSRTRRLPSSVDCRRRPAGAASLRSTG